MRDDTSDRVMIENRLGYIWVVLPESLNIGNYSDIETAVIRQLTGGADHLVFDLSRVRAIYSSALGVLIRIRKQVGEAGGVVCLVNVCPAIIALLESLNLDKIFPMYATDVEFEISEDKAWDQKLSERKIEFIFIPQVENGMYRISFSGEMVSGHDTGSCRNFSPDPKIRLFILDLSDLTGMDSCGAGVFLGLLERIKKQGGSCRAFGANKVIRQILQFMGAGDDLAFYKSEKAALAGEEKKKK
jgi:anti-anti-sigma factor